MDLTTTALHEAGHAVASKRLFPWRPVDDLSIVPNYDEGTAGSHETLEAVEFDLTDDPAELERQNEEFRKQAVYQCAGYAALIAAGYSQREASHGCGADFARGTNAYITLKDAQRRAVDLMRNTENVAAVARIAKALIEHGTLDPDNVDALISVADGEMTEDFYQQLARLRGWIGTGG
jgi:hypothetical protein